MKRQALISLLWFPVLTLSIATSAAGQGTRITPPKSQLNKTAPVNVAAKPDLKIEEVWLAKAGPLAAAGPGARLTGTAPLGRNIWLACKLTNAGADLKTPFVVTYLIDGKVVGTEQVPGLAAGRTTFSAVIYRTQAAGAHKLRCEADREGKIAEATKDNNALEISFTVAGGSVPLKDVPGVKRGETDRPTVHNPSNPTGSTTLGHGTAGVIEDKPPRTPWAVGSGGSTPATPPNESPVASVSFQWSGALSPLEVPASLNNNLIIVAESSTLEFFSSADLSAFKSFSLDGDIRDRSTTVLAGTGKPTTFATTANGTVYCIDPVNPGIVWQRTLRRAGCADDGISAGPIVHLRRNASANFKARYLTDLVYVATNYMATSGCTSGHTTANRVYALEATDGLPVWTFNETGSEEVDGITRCASLDMANDRLIVTTKRGYSATQHTVWSIDVLTGTPVWSTNAGDIENSPVLLDDRVLVASRTGLVSALDRNTGVLIWNLQVGEPPSPSIATMTAATVPNIGRAIFIGMASGRVRLVKDNGGSGEILWDISLPGGRKAQSRVSYEPHSNMLYVGADDSQVYQINALTGAVTANRLIEASGTGIVTDPLIWYAGGVAMLAAGSSKGALAEFVLPWPTETFGQ